MITFGGIVGILVGAVLLALGIMADQGWLAFLSMGVIALSLVGGALILPASRPVAPRPRVDRAPVTPPSPAEVGFVLLVVIVAASLAIGITFGLGWLAFLSMGAVGLSIVFGFAKFARPSVH